MFRRIMVRDLSYLAQHPAATNNGFLGVLCVSKAAARDKRSSSVISVLKFFRQQGTQSSLSSHRREHCG